MPFGVSTVKETEIFKTNQLRTEYNDPEFILFVHTLIRLSSQLNLCVSLTTVSMQEKYIETGRR